MLAKDKEEKEEFVDIIEDAIEGINGQSDVSKKELENIAGDIKNISIIVNVIENADLNIICINMVAEE